MASKPASRGESPAETTSPARARTILTVEERITHIMGMMARLEWVRGKSAHPLAEEWGLAVGTVENHSTEAHRRLMSPEAYDDIKALLIHGSVELFRSAVVEGDRTGGRAIGDLLASITGAKAPQKIDATVNGSDDDERLARKLAGLVTGSTTGESPAEPDAGGTTTH